MDHNDGESRPFRIVPNISDDGPEKGKKPKSAPVKTPTKAQLAEMIGATNMMVAMADQQLALTNQEIDRLASVLEKLLKQYPSIAKFASGSNRLAVWIELGIVTYGIVSVRIAYLESKRAQTDVESGGTRNPNGDDRIGQNVFSPNVFVTEEMGISDRH